MPLQPAAVLLHIGGVQTHSKQLQTLESLTRYNGDKLHFAQKRDLVRRQATPEDLLVHRGVRSRIPELREIDRHPDLALEHRVVADAPAVGGLVGRQVAVLEGVIEGVCKALRVIVVTLDAGFVLWTTVMNVLVVMGEPTRTSMSFKYFVTAKAVRADEAVCIVIVCISVAWPDCVIAAGMLVGAIACVSCEASLGMEFTVLVPITVVSTSTPCGASPVMML